jgi:ABC-2 type transport system permease protein
MEIFGLQPIAVSIFSPESYYLHMVLQVGDETQILFPSGDLSQASIRTAIESALKRSSSGFLKVVGLWTPPQQPTPDAFGQMQPPFSSWELAAQQLRRDYEVRSLDLNTGQIPADVDVLMIIAPQQLNDKQRFAIDQFLMRGGAVVVAATNYKPNLDSFSGGLILEPITEGLLEMLAAYGLEVRQSLVMDPQNEPFPVVINRDLGGMQVQEIQALSYPFFVNVQPDKMAQNNPLVSNLSAVTLHWVSPVVIDEEKNAGREVVTLLQSGPQSWLRTNTDIQPNLELYPNLGFPVEGEQQSYPLAVSVQGVFESYFKDQESPLLTTEEGEEITAEEADVAAAVGVIETSPETARLVVIGSAEFLDDTIFDLSSRLSGDSYLNSLQFAQNVVDWSVEDLDLLSIRTRSSQVRLLKPMAEGEQSFWEGTNYIVALLALIAFGLIWHLRQRNEAPMQLLPPNEKVDQEVRLEHA